MPRPEPPLPPTDQDSGEHLARQLCECQQIKQAATQLRRWEHEGRRTWQRLAPPLPPLVAVPALLPHNVTALVDALNWRLGLLATATVPVVSVPTPKTVSIAEVTERLHLLLGQPAFIAFEDVLDRTTSRAEVIVTLWTLLELFKRQIVAIRTTNSV